MRTVGSVSPHSANESEVMDLPGTILPDPRTFEEIYARHHRAMAAYAASLLRDVPDEAEDVLQNVYLRVIRNQESIAQMNDIGQRIYLLEVVKNEVWRFRRWKLPLLKRQIPLEDAEELPLSDFQGPEATVCAEDGYRTLVQLIRKMPEIYRDILCLHFLSHLSLKQIAEQFGMNYSTVKKRFERGKVLLMEQIKRNGVNL